MNMTFGPQKTDLFGLKFDNQTEGRTVYLYDDGDQGMNLFIYINCADPFLYIFTGII